MGRGVDEKQADKENQSPSKARRSSMLWEMASSRAGAERAKDEPRISFWARKQRSGQRMARTCEK